MTTVPAVNPSAAKTASNAQRAERRRTMSRTVKDLRERLDAGTSIKPAFDWELMVEHARLRHTATVWLIGLVVLVGAVGLLWADRMLVTAWAVLMLTMQFGAAALCARFLALERKEVPLRAWRTRFLAIDAAFGFGWALLFVLPGTSSLVGDVSQFSTLLILVAVGAMLTANQPTTMFAATLPVCVPKSEEHTSELQSH